MRVRYGKPVCSKKLLLHTNMTSDKSYFTNYSNFTKSLSGTEYNNGLNIPYQYSDISSLFNEKYTHSLKLERKSEKKKKTYNKQKQ